MVHEVMLALPNTSASKLVEDGAMFEPGLLYNI
jgi:hypothetical protein